MFRGTISLILLLVLGQLTADVSAGQKEIPTVANALADDILATPLRSVAVVDFTNLEGNVTELGRFVAEEMELGLVASRRGLTVVDRSHLKALMQENRLAATGVIDPLTAQRLGQIAGVEMLVTGSIANFADSVRVVVKVLDTRTARVLAATSVDMAKTKTISDLESIGVAGPVGVDSMPRREVATGSIVVPSFQNDRMRVTLGQLALAPDRRSATLSFVVENTTRQPLLLGIEGGYSTARVALSDDVATNWLPPSDSAVRGLHVVNQMNDLAKVKDEDLTPLGPSERLSVIMRFEGIPSNQKAGSTFALSVNGLYSVGAGTKRVSIGLTGITPVAQGR